MIPFLSWCILGREATPSNGTPVSSRRIHVIFLQRMSQSHGGRDHALSELIDEPRLIY